MGALEPNCWWKHLPFGISVAGVMEYNSSIYLINTHLLPPESVLDSHVSGSVSTDTMPKLSAKGQTTSISP